MAKAIKYPKSLGACADLLYDKRTERLAAAKFVDAMEAEEKALKEHIINFLPKGDAGAIGKHHKVITGTKKIAVVEDWTLFYEYVRKNKAFDLLQRRLAEPAVQERFDAGKTIAGVGTMSVVTVSLTKV